MLDTLNVIKCREATVLVAGDWDTISIAYAGHLFMLGALFCMLLQIGKTIFFAGFLFVLTYIGSIGR